MEIRVKIDDIKDSGLELEREISVAELKDILDTDPPTGFRATGPTSLSVRLDRVDDKDIVVKGGGKLAVAADCRRCLDPVNLDVPVGFQLDYVHEERLRELVPTVKDDDEETEIAGSFADEEADQIPYSGKELDLGPAFREQLLLALPMDALCKDDCKGLCQVCGTNLNVDPCSCDRHIPDPRWAGLKNIKLS